jgi:hypothetical protein
VTFSRIKGIFYEGKTLTEDRSLPYQRLINLGGGIFPACAENSLLFLISAAKNLRLL